MEVNRDGITTSSYNLLKGAGGLIVVIPHLVIPTLLHESLRIVAKRILRL